MVLHRLEEPGKILFEKEATQEFAFGGAGREEKPGQGHEHTGCEGREDAALTTAVDVAGAQGVARREEGRWQVRNRPLGQNGEAQGQAGGQSGPERPWPFQARRERENGGEREEDEGRVGQQQPSADDD